MAELRVSMTKTVTSTVFPVVVMKPIEEQHLACENRAFVEGHEVWCWREFPHHAEPHLGEIWVDGDDEEAVTVEWGENAGAFQWL